MYILDGTRVLGLEDEFNTCGLTVVSSGTLQCGKVRSHKTESLKEAKKGPMFQKQGPKRDSLFSPHRESHKFFPKNRGITHVKLKHS